MTQEEKKKKRSNRLKVKLPLANREANSIFKAQQKKKKSISITEKANLFNQISIISNGYEAKKKKKKNTAKHMDMDIVYPQAMGFLLKEEIIMEILSRLPVQSLFRFKCVLKSWKALITDPYFERKHLNHAKNDRNFQKLLVAKKSIDRDDMFNFYRSSLSSSFQVVEDENKLDCPSNFKPVNCVIYCCCDGLVLLSVIDELDKHLLLWNPSTGESIELPLPKFQLNDYVCGLAYDVTSDDYKILAVSLKSRVKVNILIFTLKSGFWRHITNGPPDLPVMPELLDCRVDFLAFVHGSFHWVGLSPCCTIFSLNISKYVFGEIPLLEQMWHTSDLGMDVNHGVTVLEGMLCFYHSYLDLCAIGSGVFKLWVMKEYGVKESWMISLSVAAGSFYIQPLMPIYMYPDGEVLLHSSCFGDHDSVFWTSRYLYFFPQSHILREGTVYTESLISPKSLI